MSERKIGFGKIAVFILLIIDVITLVSIGYICTDNNAKWKCIAHIDKSEVKTLTFKEDVDFEISREKTVTVPKGTIIEPKNILGTRVGFYYSISEENSDEPGASEVKEKYLSTNWDCFEEKDELDRLYEEKQQLMRAERKQIFLKDFIPFIVASLLFLAIGWFINVLLIKTQWYVVLYAIYIIAFMFAFFVLPGLVLWH